MKQRTKRRIKCLIILAILLVAALFIFRGCAFRTIVSYKDDGGRKNYKVKDKNLAIYIEENIPTDYTGDIESIVDLSQQLTSDALSYSAEAKENDPNKTVLLRRANSTGYAAFTASTGNYLIDKYKLTKVWEAKPVKGKIYAFGNKVDSKNKNSIFKNHDFVVFRNKVTGREISVDPTVHDYLAIDRISKY